MKTDFAGETSLPHDDHRRLSASLKQIQDALEDLQFGQVTVIVQDGVVVQIDRTERRRVHRTR